ncbi:hypothetical protein RIF29_39688 [Crotalaria pallida]|uniref:Uncharacterized protein n=1 Tax=Crotalaria pallida TaxID=3830 RepID=A0AAN9HMQ3_CROPI
MSGVRSPAPSQKKRKKESEASIKEVKVKAVTILVGDSIVGICQLRKAALHSAAIIPLHPIFANTLPISSLYFSLFLSLSLNSHTPPPITVIGFQHSPTSPLITRHVSYPHSITVLPFPLAMSVHQI